MIQHPPVLSVIATQAVFHLKRFPGVEARGISFKAGPAIVRVNTLRPALAQFLFHGTSGEGEPRLVEERAEFVRSRSPDHDGRPVSQDTELFLTGAQPLFGSLTGRDILHDGDEVVRRSVFLA